LLLCLFSLPHRPRRSTLFPYTTLFRSTCTIEVSGAKGVIGSTTAPCTSLGSFWGVKADEPVTRIKITVPGNNVVGVDNLAFGTGDRKSTRLNSSHGSISYAVFCLKKKN